VAYNKAMNPLSVSTVKLNEYAVKTATTAIYPRRGENPVYPTLGLLGESTELLAKLHEQLDVDLTHAEIGDVCWYIARLAAELDADLAETLTMPYPVDDAIATAEMKVSHLGPLDTAIHLVKVAGEIAEEIKKSIRDSEGNIDDARRVRILVRLGSMLKLLEHLADNLNTSLETVMDQNLEKLASRAKRGKISGSGDKR
jgi:NTP pyrophosphatase (non-canonical NTP hydrolase)